MLRLMLHLAGIIKSDQAIYKSWVRGDTIKFFGYGRKNNYCKYGVNLGAAIMETDEKHANTWLLMVGACI